MKECECEILKGEIYLLDYDSTLSGYGFCYGYGYGYDDGYMFAGVNVGNAQIELNLSSNNKQVLLREGINNSLICASPDFSGSTLDVTLYCLSIDNLVRSFNGDLSTNISNTVFSVVDEFYSTCSETGFVECSFLKLKNYVDTSTLVVARDDTLATLIQGIDYLATSIGITFLISLPAGVGLIISYTTIVNTSEKIESLKYLPKIFMVTFVGENMQTGTKLIYTFNKIKLSVNSNSFILPNDDYKIIKLNGVMMKDTNVEIGKSNFFTIERITA